MAEIFPVEERFPDTDVAFDKVIAVDVANIFASSALSAALAN